MADNFSYKITTENRPLAFDFIEVLSTGETISTATATVSVREGSDPSPSSILSGTATIVGTRAVQRVLGGVSGTTYRLVMTITTSMGNTFVAVGDLPVYDTSLV